MDWAGQLIEAVTGQSLAIYLRDNLFQPLGMRDTGFLITSSQRERLAKVHQRDTEGRLESVHYEVSQEPEFFMGGGGCYGTAGDYLAFVQDVPQRRPVERRRPGAEAGDHRPDGGKQHRRARAPASCARSFVISPSTPISSRASSRNGA